MRLSIFKQFRPLISRSLVLLAAALVLSSCSKEPRDQIIGKWQVQGKQSVIEFRKDGTMVSTDDAKAIPSKYSFVDESNLVMEMSAPVGTNKMLIRMTFGVVIHGNTAELSINAPSSPGAPAKLQTLRLNRAK